MDIPMMNEINENTNAAAEAAKNTILAAMPAEGVDQTALDTSGFLTKNCCDFTKQTPNWRKRTEGWKDCWKAARQRKQRMSRQKWSSCGRILRTSK